MQKPFLLKRWPRIEFTAFGATLSKCVQASIGLISLRNDPFWEYYFFICHWEQETQDNEKFEFVHKLFFI